MERRSIGGRRLLVSLFVLIGVGALGGWWAFQATAYRVCYANSGGPIHVPGQPTPAPVHFDYPPQGCVLPDMLTGVYPPPVDGSTPRPGTGYLIAGVAFGAAIWFIGALLARGRIKRPTKSSPPAMSSSPGDPGLR